MTKIDVISGFLGAGKTTFIKKLLSEALKSETIVLIENEFGQVSIDGGFLKDSGIEIKEMSQGCICCSLVGDFEKSLKEVIEKFNPDRVIIEPSGVGKLSDVMKAVTDAAQNLDVELNSAVTIVDVKKCAMYMKNFGEFFNNQIQYAGTVVLSRTDIADEKQKDAAVLLIRQINQSAEIITTPVYELSGERLLEIIEKHDTMLDDMRKEALEEPDGEDEEEHCCHHHHHHDDDDDEEECCHHHHHDDDDEECCHHHHHHHHDDDDEECCHHHHHDDDDDDDEECCHHHHHDDNDDDEECCHHHHHDDDDDDEECCHHHHHHHHHHHGHDADEIFDSFGAENVPPVDRTSLEKILKSISEGNEFGVIIRCKGMLKAADADIWYHFDLVPGEFEIREGSPDYTGKVCVIGAELKKDAIKNAFSVR